MLPKKLTSGDQFKAVTIRTINALIDYVCKQRIIAGQGITLHRYASGTIVCAQVSDNHSVSTVNNESYSGYFSIKLRTAGETKKIVVCDGKSYDAKAGASGDSLVMVNGLMRLVPYTEFDIPSDQHAYIYVKYISIFEDADSGDRCEVRLGSEDDISEETSIALIGEITKKENDNISITQRHGTVLSKSTNGVPYIDWTYTCEMNYAEN